VDVRSRGRLDSQIHAEESETTVKTEIMTEIGEEGIAQEHPGTTGRKRGRRGCPKQKERQLDKKPWIWLIKTRSIGLALLEGNPQNWARIRTKEKAGGTCL